MKKLNILSVYSSSLISEIKKYRDLKDRNKKDFSPTRLDLGVVEFIIPRHFGFCYGVENALEIIHKAILEHSDKNIYLISEIIHNPLVNEDLRSKGVKFIIDSYGNQIIEWDKIKKDSVLIVPAFGIPVETKNKILELGFIQYSYDTTCPFVVKVWNKAQELGKQGFTIIVHGKHKHEETRATFSHSKQYAPTLIIRNIEEVKMLCDFILSSELSNHSKQQEFFNYFRNKYSEGFDPSKHLEKIGVVNQTTMLATETKAISDYIKSAMIKKYGEKEINEHFADTRDTLCYATHHNQKSTLEMLNSEADLAIVIGGYNSSNTTHIVELCEKNFPTYFISSEDNIISKAKIKHFDIHKLIETESQNYLPEKEKVKIILTSGASCPDSVIDRVFKKIVSFFNIAKIPDNIENIIT